MKRWLVAVLVISFSVTIFGAGAYFFNAKSLDLEFEQNENAPYQSMFEVRPDNYRIERQPVPRVLEGECPELSLDCLSSRDEWNPVQHGPGVKRIDPDDLSFSVDNGHRYELVEGFLVRTRVVNSDNKFCNGKHEHWVRCSEFGPEAYTEIAIQSAYTGEVIHAYKMDEGDSFLVTDVLAEHGDMYYGGFEYCGEYGVAVVFWDRGGDRTHSCIHPATGTIDVEPIILSCEEQFGVDASEAQRKYCINDFSKPSMMFR